ncbi:molybdopterin binding domain protein [Anaerostipes caccae L1-92]|uniref:Molybdopterin molybdenumtransferase n=1 Tax=Anaerostipes caccae (strain DSM 14662 / CCUG 47493 / JCM 13470 / NCIMB 13811 / L1-92) TaxID=411490 RepID=B0MJG4_ANACD|nr:molybdopterin binding domain protein [Anaerostipes caccae L1-92]
MRKDSEEGETMKKVRVQDAVGMVLCHDMTEIVPGKFKGRAFKKGHVVKEEDIEKLLDIGKRYLYVWDLEEGYVHEDDAAQRMVKAAAGANISYGEPREGKIELRASCRGVLRINIDLLYELNGLKDVCFSTIHSGKTVEEGKVLAGTRVIPLVTEEDMLLQFEKLCEEKGPLIEVLPFRHTKIGIVTTGSEIADGRIEDKFGPVLKRKAEELDGEIIGQVFPGDEKEEITNAILDFIGQGADMVQVSGGMSVDPDDVTPSAIRDCGGEAVTYGSPVLPGTMFMLSYVKGIPVVGLPGCVMYSKRTVFDLAVPRLLAGEKLTREDFIKMAHGGFCMQCDPCTYPDCGFGR